MIATNEIDSTVGIRILFGIFMMLVVSMLIPTVSSEIQTLGTFRLDNCIELLQTCSNCTYVNITSVRYPNNTASITSRQMTKIGTEYNYSYCGTGVTGTYLVSGIGDVDGMITNFEYDFYVTPLGKTFDTAKIITYSIVFVISLLIFLALLFFGIFLPVKNRSDEMTGYVIAVSNLKYLKILSLCFAYLVAMFIMFFTYSISRSYIDLDFITNIFYFFFMVMVVCIIPFYVLMTYLMIANWVRDSKINDMLSRGLNVR